MRYDGQLLTEAESLALIDDVDHWCRRTGTNYNKLVVVARVHVSTRSCVRYRRRRLTMVVAERLRSAMAAYPHGISRVTYRSIPKPWGGGTAATAKSEPVRVSSATCSRCGAREGRCEHTGFERNWAPGMVRA